MKKLNLKPVKEKLVKLSKTPVKIKFKKPIKILAFVLVFFITLVLFASFNVLRQRQLCGYDQLAKEGIITVSGDVNLCPNLFDTNNWGQIVLNSLNINILHAASPSNASYLDVEATNQDCTDQLNPLCWVKGTKPQLQQTNGYTNLLLVGLDTRGTSGLKNTDSIMVVSVENTSGRILLTSFPRDLHIYYKRPNGYSVNGKINAVYANDGIEGLKSVIEQITGKPIHYYAMIRFDTFISLVDKLGGVDITLDENFADVYPCGELPAGVKCPSPRYIGDANYGYFKFPAGPNHFDSTQALVFARARKYSSDYKRAERQQKLFKAILETVLKQKLSLSERIASYIDLYNVFKSEVITNVGVNEVAGVVALLDKLNGNVGRIVADPNLDRGRIVFTGGDGPEFRDKSYHQFQNYMANIWKFLPYYIEHPKILVVNATGADLPADSIVKKFISNGNPFWTVKELKRDEQAVGIKIYDLAGTKGGSLRDVQHNLTGSLIYSTEIDQIKQSDFQEDILIIVGK